MLFRFTPDTKDNSFIAKKNVTVSLVVKGASLMVAFFTTPAYLCYFSAESVMGVWFTVLSVLAWILNCDMGIGNGLRNNLVYAINANDWDKAKKLISSSYIFLGIIGAAILLILLLIGLIINWNVVFNIETKIIDRQTMTKVMSVLIVSIILQFFLRLVTSILYALQEAFLPGLLNLITNVILLCYVNIANFLGINDSIVRLAIVYLFAVNIPLMVATVWVFVKKLPHSRPSYKYYNKQYASQVIKVGSTFLWLQLVAMVVDNTNNYLIALFIGSDAVVEYQLYNSIFGVPITLLIIYATSIWSTITKAKAESNYSWIKSNYKKSMIIMTLIVVSELLIILFIQLIFNIWLGEKTIIVNYKVAAIMALYSSVMGLRTILCAYSNGLCELKIQIKYMTIGAVTNIPIAYFISRIYDSYLAIVIANIISMIPFCVIQLQWCHLNVVKHKQA